MEARLKAFKTEMERQRSQRNLWKSSNTQRPIARYGEEFLKKASFKGIGKQSHVSNAVDKHLKMRIVSSNDHTGASLNELQQRREIEMQSIPSPIVKQVRQAEAPPIVADDPVWNVTEGIQDLSFNIDYSDPIPKQVRRPRREYRPAFGSLDCPAEDLERPNAAINRTSNSIQAEKQTNSQRQATNSAQSERSNRVTKQTLSFEGEFNEKESHESFLEALNEWRSSKSDLKPSTVTTLTSTFGTQAKFPDNSFQMKFKPAMSYFDRLHLQKLRRELQSESNNQII